MIAATVRGGVVDGQGEVIPDRFSVIPLRFLQSLGRLDRLRFAELGAGSPDPFRRFLRREGRERGARGAHARRGHAASPSTSSQRPEVAVRVRSGQASSRKKSG